MSARILAGGALAALLAVAGALAAARPIEGAPQAAEVGIAHFTFAPTPLVIANGTTVTWTNRDEELHTVTSSSGAFASPGLEKDETFAYTFAAPGTYAYFCALHPYMKSTVTVK